MKTHAKAVVIGGGVVGASVLYHLARGYESEAREAARPAETFVTT